jgi:hypothetical protein
MNAAEELAPQATQSFVVGHEKRPTRVVLLTPTCEECGGADYGETVRAPSLLGARGYLRPLLRTRPGWCDAG